MDQADLSDRDVIELVVQLCTRIGMMMEDVSPVALDASREGLEKRVADLRGAIGVMMTIADAAKALVGYDCFAPSCGHTRRSRKPRKLPFTYISSDRIERAES